MLLPSSEPKRMLKLEMEIMVFMAISLLFCEKLVCFPLVVLLSKFRFFKQDDQRKLEHFD